MATLEQLRSLFPDAASDSDVIKAAAKDFGIDPMAIASELGVKVNAPGAWSSVKRGAGQVASAFGSTAQDLGLESAGKAVEGYGADVAFRNPAAVNTLGEALSSPWQTVKETVGELVPQIGTSVAAGALGRVLGGALGAAGGPAGIIAGQAAGGAAGAYLGNLVQEYGGIRSEQREAGIEDKGRAFTASTAAAALDTAFGAERLVNKIGNRGLDILSREAGAKLLPHAAKQAGLGLATEGGTEFLQTGLERFGAYKDLTSDEAINEYGMSALKGGLGGGMIRGGLSSIAGQHSILPGTTAPLNTAPGGPPPANGETPPANDIQQVFQQTPAGTTPVATMPAAATVTPSPVIGGAPETPTAPVAAAPAVVGGTTEVAQGAQAATEQVAAEQQQAQTAQTNQIARDRTFQAFGATYDPENTGQLSILGQTVVGDAQINAFGNTLAAKFDALPSVGQTIANAMAQANEQTGGKVLTFKFNPANPIGSVNNVMKALEKATTAFQIGHVESVEQAAAILNKLSESAKGAKLDQINAIFTALTGGNTTGYEAAQQVKTKGAKNERVQLQGDTGLREVPVEGGAGEAGAVGAGNVQPGGVQPIGAGGLAAGPSGEQTGLVSGEGVRAGTNADVGDAGRLGLNVGQGQGQGPVNATGEPTQAAQGVGNGGQVSNQADQVPGVVVPATAEGTTGEVSAAPVSELVKDADIISGLYAQVLTPTQQKATGMTLEQRVEMVRLALTEQASEEEIAQLTGVPTTTIDGQLRRLGIVMRSQFTEAQLAERAAIAERLGISPEALEDAHDVDSAKRAKFLSDNITAEVTPEDRARSLSRLAATFAGQNAQYTVVTPKPEMQKGKLKQYERLDVLFQRAADAFRSAEFPQGIPRRDLLEMLTPKRISSEDMLSLSKEDQTVDEEMRQQIEQGEEQTFDKTKALSDELYGTEEGGEGKSMGTIATAGGSQGEVETDKAAKLNRVEAAQRKLEKLAPKDPRREAAQAELEAAWTDYSGIKPPVAAEVTKVETPAEIQAVKDKFKTSKGDLTKFSIGELQVLLDQANKFNNKELAKKLDIEMASRTTTTEETNAVQKPSPASVPVPEPARGGQEVGKGNAEGGQAPAQGKAKIVRKKPVKAEITQENVEIKTPEEQWAALAEQFPGMPPYAALDSNEQERWNDLANRGVANLAAANKLMGEKPAPAAEVTPAVEDQQRFEREMRSLATAEKPEGEYVRTTALRYVPLEAALDIARRAAATVPLNWVQFHSQLDLTNDSAVKLVQMLQDEGVVSVPMPSIESMFEPTPTRMASKSRSFNDIFELADELPGADIATDQLAELGIEHALDYVSDWETINDSAPDAINGEIVSRGGRYAVILNEAQLTNSNHATETVTHEVGHAVDMAPHGGIYSSQPEMSVIVKDGKVTPIGAVAKELHNLYLTDKNWSEYLEYPFDTSLFAEMDNHVLVEGELFAQLFSAYVNPKTRAAIEKIAPVSAAYMAEVIKHVQSTKALQLQTAPVAAQRTLAFKNRNASGGSQARVNPAQGRQQERFASRSRVQAIEEGINGLPKQWQKPARTVTSDIPNALKKGSLAAAITEDVVALASKYMKSANKYLEAQFARQAARLNHELKIEKIIRQFDLLSNDMQNAVNKFIADSTVSGKWAYYPGAERIGRGDGNKNEFVYDINGKKRLVAPSVFEVDEDLAARFKVMSPAEQQVVRATFDHGYNTLQEKQEAVRGAINSEYQKRIAAAMGDPELEAKYKEERDAKIAAEYRLLQLDGTKPYAYLGRHGDYVVVAKSAEFKAQTELSKSKDVPTIQRESAIGWLAENRSNPEHYVVQFAETLGEADQIAADLNATGKYDQAEASEKEAFRNEGGDALSALGRLRSRFESDFADADENSKRAVDTMLGDLYLELLSEASSRKSLMQRQRVAGFDGNMMRNLATRGRSDAHFLAAVRFNDDISDAISAMREERDRNPRAASPLFNELLKRHMNSLNYEAPNILVDFMTKASSVYFLATSPAFYLQQVLQTGVISLPYMSGRLGYFRSARAISKAYGDMAAMVKGLGVSDHVDFANAPADVRDMLQKLVGMGKIDVGIDSDARVRAGDQGVTAKVLGKLQAVNNRIETVNRATAAIAAYRGYLDRYKNNDTVAATKYAAEVVSNTHGSYDAFNTPRVLNSGAGRVLLQFKRFQIIQLSMLGKLIYTSFKGASKEEKLVARRALGFITGQMAILGGLVGVPFAQQAASLLAGIFGDEDEPEDWEYKLRRAVDDPVLADLLVNGVPGVFGVNIGSRVGLGNVASLLPFTEVDLTSRSGMEKVLVGLMGPSAGLALKFADGAGMISKGDYYKGMEQMLPNGVTNAMRGVRFATEGVTMRNGDVVLKPEEITLVDAAFQAVGLPTTTITDRQRTQRTVAEFDKFFQDRSGEIKKDYIEARRAGENTSDIMTEWTKLQEARVRNGYTRQPMSDLLRAPMAATKREKDVVGGIEFNKGNRQFVRTLAEQ